MDKEERSGGDRLRRVFVHLLLIVGGATGLKDLTINVPAMVRSGDTVVLSCHYDLEGAPLYTVQWYFEGAEFYRYVPDRQPHYNIYGVDGIHVNVSESNSNDVTLVDVSRKLTGQYKCEVSAGHPSYHTLIQRATMEVVDAPKTDPTIGSEKERVTAGETLRVNCTSGASRPASAIAWKLNDNLIQKDNPMFSIRSLVIPRNDDTKTTRSHIEFKITNDMFQGGRLHLRCLASIYDVYRKSAEIEILEDTTPLLASITGDASPHSHQSNGTKGLRSSYGLATMVIAISLMTSVLMSSR